ncbi:MAG: putative DNA binding domain-containing protein [Deltaproteobacteria bacterium]|jgi:ATP-dependent DNA helicase RecG|nr:putative DNA binding domain-containing protein [Deltaproteobacteria bacterium]
MTSDLDVILSEGESFKVEFKKSPDKELPSEVCAFANASGGRIYIGIDDDCTVFGTDVSNIARSRIQDTVNKIEPRIQVDIDIIDNSIIVITVPEGTQKPYCCSQGFYLRSGPNSQKLDRNSIIEFFHNEEKIRYDEIVRNDLPITKRFNEASYKRYVKRAKISEVLDTEAILTNLNSAVQIDGKLYFTNAGALFFRTNDEDVLFRHAGVVCALFKGIDKAYVLDAKELNGDIISNVDDAIVFLKKHLRMSFKIEGLKRENVLELPEDALREAVVNAVIHRNYYEKGSRVMIEIYDDRVDIVSPGGVCKGITKNNFGKVSITRNSVLASMFYRIGYIEQMGTGIKRMKEAAKAANVSEPLFDFSAFFKVTFKRNGLKTTYHQSVQSPTDQQLVATSDRKRMVISFLEEHGQAKSKDIVQVTGLSDSRVRALLRCMARDGSIKKVGDNRFALYVLTK